MNAIQKTFGKSKVFIPVIHCIDWDQVNQQAALAQDAGADGIMLINQGGMSIPKILASCLEESKGVAEVAPNLHIGVNFLGHNIQKVMSACAHVMSLDGLQKVNLIWQDNAGFMPHNARDNLLAAERIREARAESYWKGIVFGGVAFKYQEPVALEDVGYVAYLAALAGVDVVTTSGPGTGEPPGVEKIARMKDAIGQHALAIASGMTCDNVKQFLPHADAFLVATGIESSFGHFDVELMKRMADTIHSYVVPAS